jgi:hypothetical protein
VQRISDFLVDLVEEGGEKFSVEDLLVAFKTRIYGLVFLLFGLPNILPLPGLPILCGLILFFVSVQLFFGSATPWLPPQLLKVQISKQKLAFVVHKAIPYIWKIERFARIDGGFLLEKTGKKIIALVVSVLALTLIVIPIPWVGSMPQGVAVVLLGLGMIENNSIIVTLGYVFSFIAFCVVFSILYALWFGVGLLF